MSITTTETRKDFHVKPVEKCYRNPSDLYGWPSGERFVIQQEDEAGSAYYSREAIQTIVEALQAWLDEHAPKAFEVKVGDRVQLNADRALWVNGSESATQPGRGALGTIEDGVDRDGDIWVYWDDRGSGAVDPSLLLPADEEPMPDWERKLLGGPEVGDRVRVNAVEGEYHYAPVGAKGVVVGPEVYAEHKSPIAGLIVVQFDQPSEDYWGGKGRYDGKFQFLSPKQVDVINDREKAKAAHPSSQPAQVDAYSEEEREANGRLVFVTDVDGHRAALVDGFDVSTWWDFDSNGDSLGPRNLGEHNWSERAGAVARRVLAVNPDDFKPEYSDEEREANGKLVFVRVGDYLDGDHLGIPFEALAAFGEDRVKSSDGDYIQTVYNPADFHPIPEPEPLKVGDRVRLVNLKEPHWTCHGADEFTGRTGVILELLSSGHFDTRVAVDGDGPSSRGLAFSELERV